MFKPFDLGLSFAWTKKRQLFVLSLVPALVEIVSSYIHYQLPLQQQHLFLIVIFSVAADAWLLTTVLFDGVRELRGEEESLSQLAVSALKNLPKVVLSYIGLIILLFFSVDRYPLLILMAFFVWAPAFCAGELCVPATEARRKTGDEYEEDEEPVPSITEAYQPTYFVQKHFWQLGFLRSLHFAVKNIGVTCQVILLIWLANVLPVALVGSIVPAHVGFAPVVLRVLASSWGHAIAAAASALTFLLLLNREAKMELKLGLASEAIEQKYFPKLRLQGNRLATALVLLGALASTYLVFEQTKRQTEMPANLTLSLQESRLDEGRLKVTLLLNDPDSAFRWLNPNSFAVAPVGVVVKDQLRQMFEATEPAEQEQVSLVATVVPRREDGSIIEEENFVPFYGQLNLMLYFDIPKEISEQRKFSLYFMNYLGASPRLIGTYEVS